MNDTLLDWSERFCVGVGLLDDGHKTLIDRYNRLARLLEQSRDRNQIRDGIYRFMAYARHHFEEEEDYMLFVHYKDYIRHKLEHDQLLQDTEDFISSFDVALALPDSEAIIKYFRYWLLRHILSRDAELRTFVDDSLRPSHSAEGHR